ncbi:anti-sigma B factor antagonist [Ruminiclostridium sufflavum DSM 19573]|uniref:Anti-sigma factor antagonist n=1 Tax=Ruminiclostridium sufflavum DSM 19573 TaxID=1121337 RepID=A0A318XMW8_9FIRM|nr:STAS domain-containing protein [Ruminiclostridium sufflavum]PYG88121.1 anti-sigma B factor antagonist [Ruminiclostridium sufflavum DSM 19573]
MESSVLKVVKGAIGKDTQITLSGEIDIYTSQSLKDELNEVISSCQGDIIIDCKELAYIDSTGLGILVGALKEIRKNNNDIYICNLKDNIKKLFVITGLDKLFKIKE